MKRLLRNLPEIFFIGLGTAWAAENFLASGHINYIAILISWLLFLQLIYKNRIAGIVYGNILGFFSLYMLVAVYSEFREFPTINTEAWTLLFFGVAVFGTAAFMAGKMLYRYLTTNKKHAENEFTISF
ncbi:hypothetical protein [Flavobacterium coralii]|uniref:hypothetical protein n=1 Tax=Flavobacterium coralii TaxID=2838017 RepID=UPI000C48643B|nr:hypothetical protein [Flavobacterium sp.]|tara:strand:- start:9096 stop:9479 length:384 start_codon:yes stop_codon:yes gene_type:complete